MVTIKGYTNNPELRKKEVIPGTFDAVFKAVLTEEKEVLAEIIELVIGIPKEEVIKNGVIINSEYVRENIIETDKKSIRKYMFQDSDGNVEDYGLEKYKIDLEYIENKYYNNDELTRREKIFLMFKESNREKLKEISKGDKIMDKIYKRLDKLSEDEALSLLYDEKEREEEKKQAEIEYAEEHGLNKGIKQTAKNMLERNMNIDVVAEITGLSLEEVIKLKEDI